MSETLQRLNGRRVLVVGASSGVGAATTRRLVDEGAQVVAMARRLDKLEAVAEASGATAVQVDITDAAEFEAAVDQAVDRLGGLDGLVFSAGVMLHSKPTVGPLEDWRSIYETNVIACLSSVHLAAPHLRAAGQGDVVIVGSVGASQLSHPDFTVYNSSKAALHMVARGLRLELGPEGIRVTMVSPGVIREGGMGPGTRDEALREQLIAAAATRGIPAASIAAEIAGAMAQSREVSIDEVIITPAG